MLEWLPLKMDFSEFYKELEVHFLGAGSQLMGLQLLQLELRLGKNPSRTFRLVKTSEILWQFCASCSFRVSLAHDGFWSKNEQKLHHLEEASPEASPATVTAVVRNAYTRGLAEQELFETVKAFHACNQEERQSVSTYMLKMKAYLDQIESSEKSWDYLTIYSPYTPQHNGVSKRRNQTLLDMVRSMMSLTTLPVSFWGCALESAARILNMVPTKKVNKTLSEIWHGKVLKSVLLEDPQTNAILVRRSARIPQAPKRYGFYIDAEEHELGDHGEPPNYQAALSDPESKNSLKL
nr:retrotransposon protein, putative, Ty1-copia subclass [Tanacetum cinerariifolium]